MNTPVSTSTPPTLPGLLLQRATTTPNHQALTEHSLGIWATTTWAQLLAKVVEFGNALASIGVGAGDVVALVGRNSTEWVVADLAIQGIGAVSLVVHPDFSPETTRHLIDSHLAKVAIVGDEEQHDKISEDRVGLTHLANLIVINTRGIRHVGDNDPLVSSTTSWQALIQATSSHSGTWEASARQLSPDSPATISVDILAGGGVQATTLSSRQLIGASRDVAQRLGAHGGDRLLPVESFANPLERSLSEVLMLTVDATVNIGEGGPLERLELCSVQPTLAHLPASKLAAIHADVQARQAKRGLRKLALGQVLRSKPGTAATVSRSGRRDVLLTRMAMLGVAVAAIVVQHVFKNHGGAIRLAIVAALAAAVAIVLIFGGFAVRPFVRKAYGLAGARSLLTSSDLDDSTARFFSSLGLPPQVELSNNRELNRDTNGLEA